jgi:hypothetical protein
LSFLERDIKHWRKTIRNLENFFKNVVYCVYFKVDKLLRKVNFWIWSAPRQDQSSWPTYCMADRSDRIPKLIFLNLSTLNFRSFWWLCFNVQHISQENVALLSVYCWQIWIHQKRMYKVIFFCPKIRDFFPENPKLWFKNTIFGLKHEISGWKFEVSDWKHEVSGWKPEDSDWKPNFHCETINTYENPKLRFENTKFRVTITQSFGLQ